jgi:excisionase family DNA binding protein
MNYQTESFVSAEVVAEYLGISRDTVLAMARKKQLPAHPLSGTMRRTWRFKMSEVAAAIEGKS